MQGNRENRLELSKQVPEKNVILVPIAQRFTSIIYLCIKKKIQR